MAGLAVHQDELAEAGQGESIFGIFVSEVRQCNREFRWLAFCDAALFGDGAAICDLDSALAIVFVCVLVV